MNNQERNINDFDKSTQKVINLLKLNSLTNIHT